MTVLRHELFGAVAAADGGAFLLGLSNFFSRSRHAVPGLQADHRYRVRAAPQRDTRRINGHVAAADDHGPAAHLIVLVVAHGAQQVHGGLDTRGFLAGHTGLAAALAADGQIERLVPVCAQVSQRYFLADLHAAADLNAQFFQNLNFGIDNVLLQFKRGDAIPQHMK